MAWREGGAPCGRASELLRERCGLEPDAVTFLASHTHAATYPQTAEDEELFAARVAEAVGEAIERARPAEVAYRHVDLGRGWVFNRRYFIDENYGSHCLMFNPGLAVRSDGAVDCSEQIRRAVTEDWGGDWAACGASRRAEIIADGPTDPFLHLVAFRDARSREPLGGLVRMTGHAVIVSTHWTKNRISADYPGCLCRALSASLGGEFCFLQGPAGDERPVHEKNDFETCERYGAALAARATEGAGELEYSRLMRVVCSTASLRLPAHPETPADYETAMKLHRELSEKAEENRRSGGEGWRTKRLLDRAFWCEIRSRSLKGGGFEETRREGFLSRPAAWRIGPVVLAALSGEIFARTAHQVTALARPEVRPSLVVCELANDSTGYMPTLEDFGLGGYEPNTAGIAPGGSELAARKAAELAGSV